MRVAAVQFTSSDDPEDNRDRLRRRIREAAVEGAEFVTTPEVVNCISSSRRHQAEVLVDQADDAVLAIMCEEAARAKLHVLAGSLALRPSGMERFVNRSILIGDDGTIAAQYDKIHMFDVQLSENEKYQESAAFRPGSEAVVAPLMDWQLGMSICYDVRFAELYAALASGGANLLSVPAAFTVPTGQAHWHVLLRARAIETGCYVLAPAQNGAHPHQHGAARRTYGHSLIVDPWGEVVADAGDEDITIYAEIDQVHVNEARRRIPALQHRRNIKLR